MRILTLTADGKKRYIPVNENGEFFLTELRGIVSFDDIKEAEKIVAGDMSDSSREVCCDIDSVGEYDKIIGLWEFSGRVARCMENCGRAMAEYAFFDVYSYWKNKCGQLKNKLAAGERLTARDTRLTAGFTQAARETVLEALTDEPVWDYILGAFQSGYLTSEELRELAENKLMNEDCPGEAVTELCCCDDKDVESVICMENSRRYICSALWQESVPGYYRLMWEEGRLTEREYMRLSGMWCDGYDVDLGDFEFYEGKLSDDTLKTVEAYRDMVREQLRAIYKFFGIPEKV